MYRILYLSPGPAPPEKVKERNVFYHLSRYFEGDVLSPIWGMKNNPKLRQGIKEINLAMGHFVYHVTFSDRLPKLVKIVWNSLFYLFKGILLHFLKGKYDVIISYGPFTTGMAGYLLKIITQAKLIIEIPGNPKKSFLFDSEKQDRISKIKDRISEGLVPFVINHADHVKLLYPDQLKGYEGIKNRGFSVFHDFVAISSLQPFQVSEKYILFLGFPWFLKGVDILIKAFKIVSDEFPDYKLKIVGYCPDRTYFEKIAEGNEKIEFCKPVYYDEAMAIMSKCALFVLPSRTEAMGRVLLEAMALKKPIVASNVDGIPTYIKDGFNGLLFEPGNERDLAEKIRKVLSDPDLAHRLGEYGFSYVHSHLSEKKYLERYYDLIEKVVGR